MDINTYKRLKALDIVDETENRNLWYKCVEDEIKRELERKEELERQKEEEIRRKEQEMVRAFGNLPPSPFTGAPHTVRR